jgi:hypothetical protein
VLPDASAAAQSDELKGYAKAKETDEALKAALEWSKRLNATLAVRTNFEEADGYKRFVLRTGLAVADASADAEFLGIGGETVSRGERKALLALVEALDVDIDY